MGTEAGIIFWTSFIVGALLLFSLVKREKTEAVKLFLFWGMVIPIIFTTVFLAAITVIKNQTSVTKGPVHWHADYEIYVCSQAVKDQTSYNYRFIPEAKAHEGEEDEELDLVDPAGFSNRVGTSDFHEHGDGRIHVEGVVEHLEDVSLGKFFEAIGGQLSPTFMRLPTNHGEMIVQNGMGCPGGTNGAWQIFVYKTQNNIVTQDKVTNFVDYVLSPYSNIPPGDCIIMEFTSEIKDKTDKICKFYEIALNKGELMYER
ncbi:MAG: hypothetical protein U1C57_02725 [Candidatus Doudnabacteria bacterium]|nr:hypothetical protein [Candidatus Doudnabacteria bacterium]